MWGFEGLRKKLKVPAIDMMRYRESAHHVPVPDKRSKRILGEKRGMRRDSDTHPYPLLLYM